MPTVIKYYISRRSTNRAREVRTREGKGDMALEIAEAAGKRMGWTPPDEEEEPRPPRSKGNAKQAKPRPPKKEPPPNPVVWFHFSSYLVQ